MILCVAALVYGGDYAVWRVRGSGTDTVTVSRLVVSSLKGNKEAYDFDGTDDLACTRSAFPLPEAEAWSTPCWWLRRHRQVVTRY